MKETDSYNLELEMIAVISTGQVTYDDLISDWEAVQLGSVADGGVVRTFDVELRLVF